MPRRAAKRKISSSNSNSNNTNRQQPKRAAVAASEAALASTISFQWQPIGGELKLGVPHAFLLQMSNSSGPQANPEDLYCAAFDIDWCLIRPKSGAKWPKNSSDWQWMYDCIPQKLRQLHSDNYRLLFISNQAGIEKGTVKSREIIEKCQQIIQQLNVNVDIILTCGQSHYRKPGTGAWNYYLQHCNSGKEFHKSKSIFVGDAAGRPAENGRKKDFSCSDRMFAANIGLRFQTPEEFFLGEPVTENFSWGVEDPSKLLQKCLITQGARSFHAQEQELILMIGPPACGKSTFSEKYFVNMAIYVKVNRDLLKTPEKCLKAAEAALSDGKSVVVDNTNPSPTDRAPYVALARKFKIPARAIVMETELALAHHLNYFRQSVTEGKIRRIPMVAYRVYASKFKKPEMSEGFSEIISAHFEFDPDAMTKVERDLIFKWTAPGH